MFLGRGYLLLNAREFHPRPCPRARCLVRGTSLPSLLALREWPSPLPFYSADTRGCAMRVLSAY